MFIHCVIDPRTLAYADEMWSTAQRLAAKPDRLRLGLHVTRGQGSTGHALGLQDALRNSRELAMEYPTQIIVDSDVAFLMPGWDEWIEHALAEHVVVGATYEPAGGFSTGGGPVQTYKGRPNAVFLAWDARRIDLSELDTMPAKGSNLAIDDKAMSLRYGLPIGSQLLRDVAWALPQHLDERGIRGLGLENRRFNTLPGCEGVHPTCEMFIAPDGAPFAAHQRGSSRSPFKGDDISRGFYEACDRFTSL